MKADFETEIPIFSIKSLLREDNYSIPVYQRNYAWGEAEIRQLIQDVIDSSKDEKSVNYYLGALVVSKEYLNGNYTYNTIDGQQRLTTLTLLSAALKNTHPEIDMQWFTKLNLGFTSRKKSVFTLDAIFNDVINECDSEKINPNIVKAYRLCVKLVAKLAEEYDTTVSQFADYLYEKVKILRVPLPKSIDLNHYFEIINSRGEQLEKHEILKAQLMSAFNSIQERTIKDLLTKLFNQVWEACANMERYVQFGFTVDQRHLIFGSNDWNSFIPDNFDDLLARLKKTYTTEIEDNKLCIPEILNRKDDPIHPENNETSTDRFTSVVNFQNFLLHVLRVQTASDDVALDDKRLLDIFRQQMPAKEKDKILFVKTFIFNLLICKFLYDKYIIKREYLNNNDSWSLKSVKWYSHGKAKNAAHFVNTIGSTQSDEFEGENRKVIMLLSMFHVSMPSMSYKYWINAALNYLFNRFEVNANDYIHYLEHTAKSFVFDRMLAHNPKTYYEIIYKYNFGENREPSAIDHGKLSFGKIENLVFNFLDYLLWLKLSQNHKDKRVKMFEFTPRSSVEHYYPQHPRNKDLQRLKDNYLHSFGNLCLISHSKNSRLSDFSPVAKRDYFNKSDTIDSIKQFLMMSHPSDWAEISIMAHNDEMIKVFIDNLDSDYKPQVDVSHAHKWFRRYFEEDRNLLLSTLLCFGDYSVEVSFTKWNFHDWEYIKQSEAFAGFEAYLNKNKPKNLLDIIHAFKDDANINADFRGVFIRNPKLFEYCKQGNTFWRNEGKYIILIEGQRLTKYHQELYTYLIKLFFANTLDKWYYSNAGKIYIGVNYSNNQYELGMNSHDNHFTLIIHNDDKSITHTLSSNLNGNTKAVQNLKTKGWVKVSGGEFVFTNKPVLFHLRDDYSHNEYRLFQTLQIVMKKGFNITLNANEVP